MPCKRIESLDLTTESTCDRDEDTKPADIIAESMCDPDADTIIEDTFPHPDPDADTIIENTFPHPDVDLVDPTLEMMIAIGQGGPKL